MNNFLKTIGVVGASVLDCITIYFLVSLFGNLVQFEEDNILFMSRVALGIIFVMLMSFAIRLILAKFITLEKSNEFLNNVIRWLDKASLIIALLYSICFLIQTKTRNIERGTVLYLRMAIPALLPVYTGSLLAFLSKK